ncbi:MAG: ABC transporter ATP-binding protein [Brevinematales bacterium]|jgi:oligopeptide/dipeptide ABC transporter ATP-binding protein
MDGNILEIKNLSVDFETGPGRKARVVNGVNLSVKKGEVLGLVGESGCGKSTAALSILRLIPSPPGKLSGDGIFWNGRDILGLPIEEMRDIRGSQISMIFQEPLTSFNPVQKIGRQVEEVLLLHDKSARPGSHETRRKVAEMFGHAGLKDPERVIGAFPHELSGGMRQRAMIAMALILSPELLIADEPTTALDVTIQAQILDLLKDLQGELGMSMLLITHNLGIVAQVCGRVAVMYAGRIIENSPVADLFGKPLHPYTMGLIKSVPNPSVKGRLYAIPGNIPDPMNLPSGCTFHPRCPYVMPVCREKFPDTKEAGAGRTTACWLYQGAAWKNY